jgi:hypothetical protein
VLIGSDNSKFENEFVFWLIKAGIFPRLVSDGLAWTNLPVL